MQKGDEWNAASRDSSRLDSCPSAPWIQAGKIKKRIYTIRKDKSKQYDANMRTWETENEK
jgi:hypothetical protein